MEDIQKSTLCRFILIFLFFLMVIQVWPLSELSQVYELKYYPERVQRFIHFISDILSPASAEANANVPGDVDGDCDVDKLDVNLIIAARNTPASGPDDPRDLDGDGMITVLDARKCILLCSQPRCAIVQSSCEGGDADQDGFTVDEGDCDDNDPLINPGAIEICNGIDDNCDGDVDEGFDRDGDGTADCFDGCPDDPNKVDPGICGCGVADTDSDGDGTPDCIDECPDDPNKVDPGICGCGVADTDSDGDGTPDCIDECPNDSNKTDPGICGCGVADTDSDRDGTADCYDNCPNDSDKTEPDICGCGVADTDSDLDGTLDCIDGCPDDITKIDPGVCGCGVLDLDADIDGVIDCNDQCPFTPPDEEADSSGCSAAQLDTDNDGVLNDSDICPDTPDGEPVDGNGCSDSQLPPTVTISDPVTLTTVGSSPIDVSGTVSDDAVSLFVNGVEAGVTDGAFTVTGIVLNEGMNVIVATAYDAFNNVGTANAHIHFDSTPPNIFINSPEDGAVVTSSPVTVTGLINDIVRGTVNEDQASVAVNGIDAVVSNRNFIVESVPLVEGENTITAVGADQTGNTASASISVTLDLSVGRKLTILSGNNQTATIGTQLPQPFIVSVTDGSGAPVEGVNVIFRIKENNGGLNGGERAVALVSDVNGQAQVNFTVGTWAGAGNNKVKVSSTGIQSPVVFIASGTVAPAANIHVASGSQQRGGVNQPLPEPLVAIVTDFGHNPVGNVPVTFTMTSGGGKFSNDQAEITVNTDSDGRATVSFTLGPEAGNYAHIVESNFPENTGVPASFLATGLAIGDPGDTKISGVVLDNSNNPIPGVTMRVESTTRQAITNEDGTFTIENVPVGPVHLIADGSTATIPGEYPTLAWDLVTVAGQNNTLGMPIFLLPLNTSQIQWVGGNEDVVYMLDEIPGFSLIVKANSVTFPDGSNEGYISVTQVHADKVPMPPPNGLQPRFIVTIQPPGAIFDPPAPMTLPNVDGLAPGEKTTIYSFDHDLGQFISIGTGTVTDDGMMIISDPGVGIVKAGWHCGGNPQNPGGANECGECAKCNVRLNKCFALPDSQTPNQNASDDCKKEICQGGSITSEDDNSETPPQNAPDDCKKEICQGGSITSEDDDSEVPVPECKECQGGSAVADSTQDHNTCETNKVCLNGNCVCPIPNNFQEIIGIVQSGKLHFEYSWESSTGDLGDLSNCEVGEKVDYPGDSPFEFPSPPWGSVFYDNPTIIWLPATVGHFLDDHSTAGPFVTPYEAASVTATQNYRYRCLCKNISTTKVIEGPISIVRSVSQSDSHYIFKMEKSGISLIIDPLP